MRGWTGQNAYKDWAGLLATSEEDDFERKVLPLLRLFWPPMRQAPRKKSWDARGIDLMVWSDTPPFACVVQCKGFKVQQLGADQARQAEESIERFKASDSRTKTYLLVHNRDGRDRQFATRVSQALAVLVQSGKAEEAYLWDRQTLLKKAFDQMQAVLTRALHAYSSDLLGHVQGLFRFGEVRVSNVPAVEEELIFRRDAPCKRHRLSASSPRNVGEIIEGSSGRQWTILSGIFGLGKTSAALHAARLSARPVVLLPCATVPEAVFRSGQTNALTGHVSRILNLLDEVEDQDREALQKMAASVLSYLLRSVSSPFVFVLDGLDEHRALASLEGLQQLCNQLAEFSCPVVLTTRREHFDLLFGSFDVALSGLAPKYGTQRVATGIDLQPWTRRESLALVSGAIELAGPEESARLTELRTLIEERRAEEIYGDLLYHPLFLQFILEDVACNGIRRQGRAALLRGWIERKLRRDRMALVPGTATARAEVHEGLDIDESIAKMVHAMEDIAFGMTCETRAGFELLESIDASAIRRIIHDVFGDPRPGLLPVLLNSLLVVHDRRPGGDHLVGFALRILQEYLLASRLSRRRADAKGYPDSVQVLHSEILQVLS